MQESLDGTWSNKIDIFLILQSQVKTIHIYLHYKLILTQFPHILKLF